MPTHPLSFHLVDRVLELEPGRRAWGSVTVPADAEEFPTSLVIEAIGQLAAWVAMQRADFAKRPVAARADEVRVFAEARPGVTIDLEVAIERCTNVGVTYAGGARVAGMPIAVIEGAAGAMVPMAEFEDPASARARFEQLLGDGLPPRHFPRRAMFEPRVLLVEREAGQALRAEIEVATSGELYADHFPRRPVYPATLLLDAQLRLALDLASPGVVRSAPVDLSGTWVGGVKVRAYTPPGGRVELLAQRVPSATGSPAIAISATAARGRVSSATVLFARREG